MSSHASNGRGSVVATMGLFMVVSIGSAVDRNSTGPAPSGADAAPCQPTAPPTTAVTSAPSAPITRTLADIDISLPHPVTPWRSLAGSVQVACAPSQGNLNLF